MTRNIVSFPDRQPPPVSQEDEEVSAAVSAARHSVQLVASDIHNAIAALEAQLKQIRAMIESLPNPDIAQGLAQTHAMLIEALDEVRARVTTIA